MKARPRFSLLALLVAISASGAALAGPANWTHGTDVIPNLAAVPTTHTVKAGDWNDAATWSAGVPDANDLVEIGHAVTLSGDAAGRHIAIVATGSVTVAPATSVRLSYVTLYNAGSLTCVTDTPVQFEQRRSPADPADEFQWSGGFLTLPGGRTNIDGEDRSGWLRSTVPIRAGMTSLTLEAAPVGWRAGQTVYIAETNVAEAKDVMRDEYLTLASVNDATITFTTALKFDHPGALDDAGQTVVFPGVANLSSNIEFVESGADGLKSHIIFIGHLGAVPVLRDVLISGIGRTRNDLDIDPKTNLGRYAMHFHHAHAGPEHGTPQIIVERAKIRDALKWGLAMHQASYGVLRDCVIVGADGSGYVFEDGNEVGWIWDHLYAAKIRGRGLDSYDLQNKRDTGKPGQFTIFPWGTSGAAFVRRAGLNDIANCSAEGINGYGPAYLDFQWPPAIRDQRLPAAPGEHPSVPTRTELLGNVGYRFQGNVAMGCKHGYAPWGYGGALQSYGLVDQDVLPFTVRDFTAAHFHGGAIRFYSVKNIRFENTRIYGSRPPTYRGMGIFSDYGQAIDGAHFEGGLITGVRSPIVGANVRMSFRNMSITGDKPYEIWPQGGTQVMTWPQGRDLAFDNCTFNKPIVLHHPGGTGSAPTLEDRFLIRFPGETQWLRMYREPQQRPEFVIPVNDGARIYIHPEVAAQAPGGQPTNLWVAQFLQANPGWNAANPFKHDRTNPSRFTQPLYGAVLPVEAATTRPGWTGVAFAPADAEPVIPPLPGDDDDDTEPPPGDDDDDDDTGGEPPPAKPTVTIDVTSPPEVDVQVKVNGQTR